MDQINALFLVSTCICRLKWNVVFILEENQENLDKNCQGKPKNNNTKSNSTYMQC